MFSPPIKEDGLRWMTPQEQSQAFPSVHELKPYEDRPVWLVLSIVCRSLGCRFDSGFGVSGQMRNLRAACGTLHRCK